MGRLKEILRKLLDNIYLLILSYILFAGLGVLGSWAIPYFSREFTYDGPDISGKWETEFVFEDVEGHEEVYLSQNGHKISGTIHTITFRPDSTKRILDSEVIGEFRDDYLIAYYIPKAPSKFGCGTFTFRLVEGGRKLEGICPFQYTQDRELKVLEYGWTKSGDIVSN